MRYQNQEYNRTENKIVFLFPASCDVNWQAIESQNASFTQSQGNSKIKLDFPYGHKTSEKSLIPILEIEKRF
jgi:hypothetical protein